MNEQPIEHMEVAAHDERADWMRPEVARISAGEAENSAAATFDGGGFS